MAAVATTTTTRGINLRIRIDSAAWNVAYLWKFGTSWLYMLQQFRTILIIVCDNMCNGKPLDSSCLAGIYISSEESMS